MCSCTSSFAPSTANRAWSTEGGRVTQVGEGHETAADADGPVMTFGAPTVGEVLADRYQLQEHVNNDSAGRQVWRGIDVILRRPVAVVLRYPGGDSATEMLHAAVDASRVIHPNLVGVYDAIDEASRAYVVREWVDGESLRELVGRDGPQDPARATAIAHALVDALTAVHATGMVHGNVHPGTALIGDDGRVVLADARADSADDSETDIRSIGGILYYALTGHWPHAEVGRSALPDANRDGSGNPPRRDRSAPASRPTSTTSPWTCWTSGWPRPRPTRSPPSWPGWTPPRTSTKTSARCASPRTPRVRPGPQHPEDHTRGRRPGGDRPHRPGLRHPRDHQLRPARGRPRPRRHNNPPAGRPPARTAAPPGDTPTPKKIAADRRDVRIVDPPPGDPGRHRRGPVHGRRRQGNGLGDPALQPVQFRQSQGGHGRPDRPGHAAYGQRGPGRDVRAGCGDGSPHRPVGPGRHQRRRRADREDVQPVDDGDAEKTDGTSEILPVLDPRQKYQYILLCLPSCRRDDDGNYRVSVNRSRCTATERVIAPSHPSTRLLA